MMMYSKDAPLIFFQLLAVGAAAPSTIRGHQGDPFLLDDGHLVSVGDFNRGGAAHSVAKLLASGSSGEAGNRYSIVAGWWDKACFETNEENHSTRFFMAVEASKRMSWGSDWTNWDDGKWNSASYNDSGCQQNGFDADEMVNCWDNIGVHAGCMYD